MPIIRVELLPGRTPALKAQLARELTECAARLLEAQPGHIYVIYSEIEAVDWAVGGQPLSAHASPADEAGLAEARPAGSAAGEGPATGDGHDR